MVVLPALSNVGWAEVSHGCDWTVRIRFTYLSSPSMRIRTSSFFDHSRLKRDEKVTPMSSVKVIGSMSEARSS